MKWFMKEGRARWGTLMSVYIVAVVLNYLWELTQAPLYVGWESYNTGVLWHCFVASLGDGIMVLLIVAAGRIALHRWNWFERPGFLGCFVMVASGLVLAVLVEWVGVNILGRWEYTARMPIMPEVGVALVPIAQMLVLPPLIFQIVAVYGAKTRA